MIREQRTFVGTIALLLAMATVAGSTAGAAQQPQQPQRPNIILFLVDDMGWMDTTVYGSRYYDTPNMERLARGSMMFTDAYTANPLCSPTRASILTGQYPARIGITSAVGHRPPLAADAPRYAASAASNRQMLLPESRRFLDPGHYTIAEALHEAGYRTAHLGKWHLGLREEHWPETQGFDVVFHGAPDPGPRSYFSPYQFRAGNVTNGPEGEYITDRLTDEALAFIDENRDRPFLLHLWQYGVHGPWGHKEELTQRYRDRTDPRGQQNNPIMASMLKSVDESLGRVLDRLDELQIAQRTIVIFFSDNGGNVHSRIGPDNLPPTNNAPLRMGKAWLYEGGVRVPLMVRWPGVVAAGSRCSEVVSSIDLYPTMLEMAGLAPKEDQVLDGLSIAPLLKQNGTLDREAVYNYFPHGGPTRPPGATVRSGDWKLIRWFETSDEFPDRFELYNLKDDLGETNNLAAKMPQRVARLDASIEVFLKETGALAPKPNPAYDPTVAALEGWVPKSCTVEVEGGSLRVRGEGRAPFLAITRLSRLQHEGQVVLRLRSRSDEAGQGRLQWRTAGQEKFNNRQIVSFDLAGDGEFQTTAVQLPIEGKLIHVRLYLPAQRQSVDVDWIRLERPVGDDPPLLEWNFNSLPQRPG